MTRLEQCVVQKSHPRLAYGTDTERILREQLEPEWRQQSGELTQLAGVAACENDAHSYLWSVCACRAKSCPMPDAARLSSASSS